MTKAINVQALNDIAVEIKAQLETIGKATFKVGELLCQAQEMLPKKSDIVAWAEAEVGVKKAQTYRLMQVYRAFKDEPWAYGIAVDALAMLIGEEEAKQVVKQVAESGENVTTNEVKEIVEELREEAGEGKTEPQPEPQPEPEKPKTAAQLQKDLDKVSKLAEQQKAQFEQKEKEFKKARDTAIKAARTMEEELAAAKKRIEELESANNVKASIIAQQHKTIAELRAKLEMQPDILLETGLSVEEEVVDTVGENDDLPWEEEEEVVNTDSDKLAVFEEVYLELQAANPRKMVDNTKQAAEKAGIEITGTGRAVKFELNGEQLTGSELRALIK